MINELRHRDPFLFWIGAAMLLALIVVTLLSIGDTRADPRPQSVDQADEVPHLDHDLPVDGRVVHARDAGPIAGSGCRQHIVRWTIGPAMLIEIACIILQSARGTTSHFNNTTPFDAIIFSVMGMTICEHHRDGDLPLDHPPRHAAAARRLHLGHPPRRGDLPARQPARAG